MKQKLLSLLAVMLMALTANAQHDYVDLGLPSGTLWATCNVGANSPEKAGYYFAWGETELKYNYNWSTYKWRKNSSLPGYTQINKYTVDDNQTDACWYDSYGNFIGDGMTELLPEDDAATVNLGSDWQMPSKEQIDELLDGSNTTIEWTQEKDVNGMRFTSTRNGKSIFLPAAGYFNDTYNISPNNGFYWSRSLDKNFSEAAHGLFLDYSGAGNYNAMRYRGMNVRPVRVKGTDPDPNPNEVYTEFVEETGTLTYYCDTQREERTGITELYDPVGNPDVARFTGYYKKVKKAVIDPSMKDAPLTSMYSMFFGGINGETFTFQTLSNMTEIKGMENLNTANVTRMDWMFEACNSLQTIDVSSFDVSKVTKMDYMFGDCYKLTTIYCNDDWSNTTASSFYMFSYCTSLVGGKGTVFDSEVKDATYARPDGGTESPGYFTERLYPAGDVNCDKAVDIADVVAVLSAMAGGTVQGNADVNSDTAVDIADVVAVLSIMAGN